MLFIDQDPYVAVEDLYSGWQPIQRSERLVRDAAVHSRTEILICIILYNLFHQSRVAWHLILECVLKGLSARHFALPRPYPLRKPNQVNR